jgi:hypothetical protein
MEDDKGLYYYPFPANKHVRMYVRETGNGIEFRMWNGDDPELWEAHGWVPYDAIAQASAMYKGRFDPRKAYDIDLARSLIMDARARLR